MTKPALLVLGMGLGALVLPVVTVLTTLWFNRWHLPRVAADFDPGPGLWLEKRG